MKQADASAMRITTGKRFCRKCGATIPPNSPQQSCSACLLEAGLDGDEGANVVDVDFPSAEPLLMDFGDYELIEKIGRGGQGVVFRARQKSLNRTVALKVIALGHWATESHLKRFRLEAEAAARLDYAGIVPIYDIGERDGSCYFSMKLIDGGQLDEVVRREPLSIRRSVELLAKIARTVHYAHEHGVLHRDIKPGNILLDSQGEPHLTDFGLARLVEGDSEVTRTMEVLGTPSYMAPEEAAGRTSEITPATDVYGLGAVLYQLLTGHPPFAGGTTYQTIRMVLENEPTKPRFWNSKVDVDLETICVKCLEKDPPRRYSSALAVAEDLERWLRHEPILARRTGPLRRVAKWIRRNPSTAALAAACTGLLAIAVSMVLLREPAPPPTGLAVLPFENLSGDKADTSFADGLQDDILTRLAKIADLKVISRTSVMQYRGERNMRKIGNALRVSHVLEGSVRKVGNRIRLNAQLIDTRNDVHVWADQYVGESDDIFALQSEIAQKVAAQLKSKVSASEKAAIDAKPTHDVEAYKLYVQAKQFASVVAPDDPASIEKQARGVELLERAVARDPNFALAHCLLAQSDLGLYWIGGRAEPARRDRAEVALRAAQRIAPEAGETHVAQAAFYHYGKRDYDRALEELEYAARLLPNSADVFYLGGLIERRLGRWKEALRHFAKADELNPRDATGLAQLVVTYGLLRHYPEAERLADRGIATFPDAAWQFWKLKGQYAVEQGDVERGGAAAEKVRDRFPFLHWSVAYYRHDFAEAEKIGLSVWQGKDITFARFFAFPTALAARARGATDRMQAYMTAARRSFELSLHSDAVDPDVLSYLGMIDAALGQNAQAISEARRAIELMPISRDALEGPMYRTNLALVYAWTGEHERAIEQLSTVVKMPNGPSFGELKFSPAWDVLRDDQRFAQLVAEAAQPISLD